MRKAPPSASLSTLALVGALVLGGCSGDSSMQLPPLPDSAIDVELLESLRTLHDAASQHSDSGEARGRLAMAYDVNDFHQRAIAVYEQAAKLAPDEFHWPYFRALLLASADTDYEAALRSLDAAIALDDGYVAAWLWRGAWLRELKRPQDARAAYERAAELGAGAPALVGLAHLLFAADRFDEAVALLEPLNAEQPDPRVDRLLGRAYQALGRNEDARIALARGQSAPTMQWMDPKLALRVSLIAGFSNRLRHAQNLIQAGRPADALVIAKALVDERPDDVTAINTLVWAHAAIGRFAQARVALRKGLEQFPNETRLHLMLANAYRQQGDGNGARRQLERVLALAPDHARALEQLGWLLAQQGDAERGIALLEQALQNGAREPKEVLYRLGLLEGAAKRWPQAISHFQQAAQLDASFTMAHIHLGRCLAEAGRIDEARAALDWADRIGTEAEQRASARRRLQELAQESEATG